LDHGKTYRFHLRKDALLSDGKPVTAYDFVYAWQRLLDPKTAAPYAFFLYDIKMHLILIRAKFLDPQKSWY